MTRATQDPWAASIGLQFGAAVDMVENALRACPAWLWCDRAQRPESRFWYLAYHTLFFLDLFLSEAAEGFVPPAPFTLDELDPDEVVPEDPYSKEALLAYLEHGRRKLRATIAALTVANASERRRFTSIEGTLAELLLYNLRHVQHHAAQLNLLLRQRTDSAPKYVKRAAT